jgi:DNA-binding response OmpR family regulator
VQQRTVVVIEDEASIASAVAARLRSEGFRVETAGDGPAGVALCHDLRPDLVILDLMLPGLDGLEVCRRMRAAAPDLPVVMLTALGEESDRVLGLEIGADDYVTKPFSPRELVLRIRSVLRRAAPPPASVESLLDGDLSVDVARRIVRLGEREIALTVREFDLLVFLMRHPGRVFRRAELLEQVWGWTFGDQSTVTVHMRRLREKIEDDPAEPKRILTVWGVGYRYEYV